MKRKLICGALCLGLCLSSVQGAEAGFHDVKESDWFAPYVEVCVKAGLMEGTDKGFEPEKVLSQAEAVTLAARVGAAMKGDTLRPLRQGEDWWLPYEEYVLGGRYLSAPPDFASRLQFVSLLDRVLPEDLLIPINDISLTDIPDNDPTIGRSEYGEVTLRFYQAGILTGRDAYGSFGPTYSLTRSEAAAMLARVLDPSLRLSFTLAQPERRGYTLTEMALPQGWVPTADSNNAAAGWATIQRVENEAVAEEAICRADGKILSLDGYFVYGFEHPTSRGDAKRLPVSTHQGVALGPETLFDSLWNIYDVEQERFLLETALFGDDPAWDAAWEEYFFTPQTWPQPELDESTGLYGYVDREGNWVIPAQYYYAGSFTDGAAVVHFRDGMISAAAIDETGKELLPRRYDDLWYLGEGVFNYWGDLSSWEGDDWRMDCGTVTMEGVETPTAAFSGYFNGGLTAHHGLVAVGHEADSNWVMTYYDLAGNQASEDFDWAGPIGDDGAGFVSKDGKLWRIQFSEG